MLSLLVFLFAAVSDPVLREQELRARLRSLMASRGASSDPACDQSFQDEELRIHADFARLRSKPTPTADFVRETEDFVKSPPDSASEPPIVDVVMTFIEDQIDTAITFKIARLILMMILLVCIGLAAYEHLTVGKHKKRNSDELPSAFEGHC
jgi:hypothetical protein